MNDNEKPKFGELRQMLSFKQVLSMIPVSRTTLDKMIKDGKFPKPRPVTPTKFGFYLDEVVEWQRALDQAA